MSVRTRTSPARASRLALVCAAALLSTTAFAGGSATVTPGDLFNQVPFDKLPDAIKKIKDVYEKGDEYYKDVEALSPDDKGYEPENPPGAPELPSLCKDSSKCEECFEKPHDDLQNTRLRFEKLRRLNRVTKKMLRDSVSFGDAAASAAGGLVPLAWDTEKRKIRASEENFNKSYDSKYEELLATLRQNLNDISACEEKIFDEQGWYDRYGFIYQQFMADAYRRPD